MQIPPQLIQSLQHIKGFHRPSFEAVHSSGEQITSIRINPAKITDTSIINYPLEKIPWASSGYYLPERPSFTTDPLFHAGAYYVQEASSMFLEEALKQTADLSQPLRVLDLCAAPGGKSTLIQSLISNESLLVSNEVIKARVNILSENIAKWGAANVIVTNNDPKDFQRLENYFDVIVVDAPCSGSGLFRKDPAAVSEWSWQNVLLCSQRQQRILADVLPSLKENGILVYSTCSYSEEEDEQIADWLCETFKVESLRFKVDGQWNVVETVSSKHNAYGYRFYPDKVKGEGFFIAAFKKNDSDNESKTKKSKTKSEKATAKEVDIVKPYIKNAAGYFFIKQNEEVIAVPKNFEDSLAAIQNALYIKKAGINLGAVIRNELIPAHELALSTIFSENIPTEEVDEDTALQYLRRQDIRIKTAIKGWAMVTFKKMPLGWVKILPNRINNYYPKDWRILNK